MLRPAPRNRSAELSASLEYWSRRIGKPASWNEQRFDSRNDSKEWTHSVWYFKTSLQVLINSSKSCVCVCVCGICKRLIYRSSTGVSVCYWRVKSHRVSCKKHLYEQTRSQVPRLSDFREFVAFTCFTWSWVVQTCRTSHELTKNLPWNPNSEWIWSLKMMTNELK